MISALDRFAQFFIAPLMKKNAMEREREAVDSEFEQALPSDFNRRQQGPHSIALNLFGQGPFLGLFSCPF